MKKDLDFSKLLHYPLYKNAHFFNKHLLQGTPDEEEPLLKLFKQILNQGLTSIHGKPKKAKVVVIGAGPAGLSAAYELKRSGLDVVILEASQRVGGRVKTIRDPFTKNLHGEGGAMRLPKNHELVRTYLKNLKLENQLEDFEQKNKLIYISTYGKTITYTEFDKLLINQDKELLRSFPKLKKSEKGKTIDTLWNEAIAPVLLDFDKVYNGNPDNTEKAYAAVVEKYDQYSLRTYFEQVAGWSQDCITLYDLGSPHVVLDNAFIESWKDAFLSSQSEGEAAGMQQLKGGMDTIPYAFLDSSLEYSLKDDIRFGAKAREVNRKLRHIEILYTNNIGVQSIEIADYVIFAIPFTSQRLIKLNRPFSIEKQNAIRELRYVEVTKILLQFKTRWWEPYLDKLGQGKDGGVVTDLPIRYTMFPPSNSAQFENEKRGVIMASYTFQQDATGTGANDSQEIIRLAADNLATIFGEVVYDNLETGASQVWSGDPFSGGSAFAYFAPMQKTRLFKAMINPEWSGKAHFAGEHNSYSHGWIEGAFESALRVAYEIYSNQIK